MKISKIVITGGPCGGKSTALGRIKDRFTAKGYRVLFVSETATELISGGVAPWTCGTNGEFQKCQMKLQLEKERLYEKAASTMDADRVLIVCDRGAVDNKAYMNGDELEAVLEFIGCDEEALMQGYDAVFHLVSAAKGAEEFYTTANNSARTETVAEAAALDDTVLALWSDHPYHRVIDNRYGFEEKLEKLLKEIEAFLEKDAPLEIERKYLIEYPDMEWLACQPHCRRAEIVQTYLKGGDGEERIRKWTESGSVRYYHTVKHSLTGLKRIEKERVIDGEEYAALAQRADPERRPLSKTRYSLDYKGQCLEIDIYPFWSDRAILEVELENEGAEVLLPPEIRVIKEVTGEAEYKNSALARAGA